MSNHDHDLFDAVSSFYGPGTVLGWYFTLISVGISCAVPPPKSRRGYLDADLIAAVTLPVAAAFDVIQQLRSFFRHNPCEDDSSGGMDSPQCLQFAAVIAAPLTLIANFMHLGLGSFLLCFLGRTIRAQMLLMVLAVSLCYHVVGYINSYSWWLAPSLDRAYRSRIKQRTGDWDPVGVVTTLPVFWCYFKFVGIPHLRSVRISFTRWQTYFLVFVDLWFPISVVQIFCWIFRESLWFAVESDNKTIPFSQCIGHDFSRILRAYFPRTNCSIIDLDQFVAATSAATVLLLNLLDIAIEKRKEGQVRKASDTAEEWIEMDVLPPGRQYASLLQASSSPLGLVDTHKENQAVEHTSPGSLIDSTIDG